MCDGYAASADSFTAGVEARREFYRWLAKERAQIRAEAAREIAEAIKQQGAQTGTQAAGDMNRATQVALDFAERLAHDGEPGPRQR